MKNRLNRIMIKAGLFEIVNYTPHPIKIDGYDEIPSSGVARVEQKLSHIDDIDYKNGTVPLYKSSFGSVKGLPPKKDFTLVIVSSMVKAAAPNRNDLIVPTNFTRDASGNIKSCEGFII